jgi:hypothetical protein
MPAIFLLVFREVVCITSIRVFVFELLAFLFIRLGVYS